MLWDALGVKDGCLRRHVSVHDTELLRVGRPCAVVDGPFLVQVNTRVESSIRAEDIQVRLAVVALIALVNIRLREHSHARALLIPLHLDFISLVERLL